VQARKKCVLKKMVYTTIIHNREFVFSERSGGAERAPPSVAEEWPLQTKEEEYKSPGFAGAIKFTK